MAKSHSVSPPSPTFVLAADNASLGAMAFALDAVGVHPVTRIRLSDDAKEITTAANSPDAKRMLLSMDTPLSIEVLDAVRRQTSQTGWVGVWRRTDTSSPEEVFGTWLSEQLLFQHGATLHSSLAVLAAAMRLHPLKSQLTSPAVPVTGKPSGILDRLKKSLVDNGFEVVASKKEAFFIVSDHGEILLGKEPTPAPIGEPTAAVSALKLVCRDLFEDSIEETELEIRQKDVDLIVQPPPRLLSEPTSKKLFCAFGMSASDDQLCGSPTEASRVVSARGGVFAFKLAKPRLEKKQAAGAVVLGVAGATGARRAVQTLASLGDSLGPPPPLGILVCPQIDGGIRVWIKMQLHPVFGRVVLLGAGDNPNKPPLAAFKTPVSSADALRSLADIDFGSAVDASPADKTEGFRKIARSVSTFSRMVQTLSGRINRAEIHPLVAAKDHSEALVLDALAAVGPDEP